MAGNLFLEGPIQTGKSTLIRQVLGDRLRLCGGFASQRLLDSKGNTRGFRIGPAAETSLTAPAPEHLPDSPSQEDGIFLWRTEEGMTSFPRVFSKRALSLLKDAEEHPLILLDEIGGIELASDSFFDRLLRLLQGPVPCLGVLKLKENMERLNKRGAGDGTLPRRYEAVRRILEDGGSRLLEDGGNRLLCYDRQRDSGAARRELESFLAFLPDSR